MYYNNAHCGYYTPMLLKTNLQSLLLEVTLHYLIHNYFYRSNTYDHGDTQSNLTPEIMDTSLLCDTAHCEYFN